MTYRSHTITLTRSTLQGVRAWHYVICREGRQLAEGWHTGQRWQVEAEARRNVDARLAEQERAA